MKAEFGELLRQLRLNAGRSMGELARHLKVSVTYVSDVELGRRAPLTKERIEDTARFLGVPVNQLHAAAARSRGYFELDASDISERGQEVGAALMREWTSFTDSDFGELDEFLRRRREK